VVPYPKSRFTGERELAQERGPDRLGLGRTDIRAKSPARTILLTPTTAMITATKTMRPFWRTFT
jgi:hypothetical protein